MTPIDVGDENIARESNKKLSTPQRQLKEAFDAEKKIIGAKYSQEKEEYEKMI